MAFGFGVGDIIALTTIIVKTVEEIHDAPKELQDLAKRVESVEEILESIHEKLPHNEPAQNMTNIERNIERRKERVKEVLETMKDIVIKYRDDKGRVKFLNKVIYSVWDKGDVAKLVVKLEERTRKLIDFLLVQIWAMNNQIRPLIEQILAQTRQDQGHANIQKTDSDHVDQVKAILDRVLQNERPSDPTLPPDEEDVSIENQIVLQMEQAGVESSLTKALVERIDKQRKQIFHAEDVDPVSYTRGNDHLEDSKGWIMVVDSYNEGDTIIFDLFF